MPLKKAFNEKMTKGEGMLRNWFSLMAKTNLKVENKWKSAP